MVSFTDRVNERYDTNTHQDHIHKHGPTWLLYTTTVVAIFVFVLDWWVNFSRSGSYTTAIGYAYGILAALVYLLVREAGAGKRQAIWLSTQRFILAYGVPLAIVFVMGEKWGLDTWLANYVPSAGAGSLAAVLFFKYLPLWIIYYYGFAHWLIVQCGKTGSKFGNFFRSVNNFLFLCLFLMGILFFAHSVSGIQVDSTYETPGFIEVGTDLWAFGKDTISTISTGVGVQITNTRKGVNNTFTAVTNPHYTGNVERSQGKELGVFIKDIDPLSPVFYFSYKNATTIELGQDREVVWYGTVQARTFIEDIPIQLGCMYESGPLNYSESASPPVIPIYYTGELEEEFNFVCDMDMQNFFIQDPAVTSGRFYTTADFPFQTWGYTTLTFMDRGLMTALRRENQDPARYLGIDKTQVSRYTPGPISLGMNTVSQPIGINLEEDEQGDVYNVLPVFGVSITDAWIGEGDIKEMDQLILQVPEPLELDQDECSGVPGANISVRYTKIEPHTQQVIPPGYTWYVFNELDFSQDHQQTVRCPLITEDFADLLGPALTPKQFTLVAQVTYEYQIRQPVNTRLGVLR